MSNEKREFELISINSCAPSCLGEANKKGKEPYGTSWRDESFSTGYQDLDYLIGGIGKGLTVIAGRTLNGNEVLHRNILENIFCRYDSYVLHIELGINLKSFYNRVLSSLSRTSFHNIESGYISEEERIRVSATKDLLDELKGKLFVHNKSTYVEDIPSIIQQLSQSNRTPSVISISSIQNLRSKREFESRYAEMCYLSKKLKSICLDFDTRMIVGSSVNRKCEERVDKRPRIFDLRDSGTLEEDANVVLFTYNDNIYDRVEENSSNTVSEIIVAKNDYGEIGELQLINAFQYSRFDFYYWSDE